MTFLDRKAPWGSPVVSSIPLPPFADHAQHDRYVRMLQLHLALLDGGSPTLSTIALSLALERPQFRTEPEDPAWLTTLELAVSPTTWFPAPWTPTSLAQTLRTHLDPPVLAGQNWYWLYDPDFLAEPQADGGWTVTEHERGSRVTDCLSGDRDLVVLWISIFRDKHAFPLTRRPDESVIAALAPASLAVLRADETDAAYPYRASWRADREAALATATATAAATAAAAAAAAAGTSTPTPTPRPTGSDTSDSAGKTTP